MAIFFLTFYIVVLAVAVAFSPRDAMQARPMPSCGVCLSVCMSVSFVHFAKMNKRVFEFFSLSTSQAILVFFVPNVMAIFRRESPSPNGSVECRWGRQKSRFWAYIWLNCLLLTLQQTRCCQHGHRWTTATVAQVVTRRW